MNSKSDLDNGEENESLSLNDILNTLNNMTNDPIQKYYSMLGDAQDLLHDGKIAEAKNALTELIRFNEHEPTAYIILSRILYSEGEWLAASERLQQAIQVEPHNKEISLLNGSLLQLAGQNESALINYVEAVHADLNDQFDSSVLSKITAENNQMLIALADFVKEIPLDEKGDCYHLVKAALQMVMSRRDPSLKYEEGFEKPIHLLNEAISINPENPSNYWLRILVKNKFEDKHRDISQAIKLKSDRPIYRWLRAYAELMEDVRKNYQDDVNEVIEKDPHNPEPFEKIGIYHLFKEQDFPKAIDVFCKGLDHVPNHANFYYYLGLAYEKNGKKSEAIKNYKEYIELSDNDGDTDVNKVAMRIKSLEENGGENARSDENEDAVGSDDFKNAIIEKFTSRGEESKEDNDDEITFSIDEDGSLVFEMTNPQDEELSQEYYKTAMCLFLDKKYSESIPLFLKAIEADPENEDIYFHRGCAYLSLKEFENALQDFHQYIQHEPTLINEILYMGVIAACAENENWDVGIKIFSEIIIKNPKEIDAYFYRGQLHNFKKDYEKALKDFDQVIMLKPESAGCYRLKGQIFEEKGEILEAISDYQMSLEFDLDPGVQKDIRNKIRELCARRKGLENKTCKLDSDPRKLEAAQSHLSKYAKSFKKMKFEKKALQDCQIAINLAPDLRLPYEILFFAYMQKSDWDEAEECINAAINIDQKDASLYNNRGVIYFRTNQLDKALSDFNMALKYHPRDLFALRNIGSIYANQGKFDLAIEHFTKVMDQTPEDVGAILYRAISHERNGNIEKALIDYKKYCELGAGAELELDYTKAHIKELEKKIQ